MNETLIRQKFNQAAQGSFHFAAIRLPDEPAIHFLYSHQSPLLESVPLHATQKLPAFVCSLYSAGNLAYTLQAEHYYHNDELIGGEALDESNSEAKLFTAVEPNFIATQKQYKEYVQLGVEAINQNRLDKMVAARSAQLSLPPQFDIALHFTKLTHEYPHACVYFFHLKDIGTWCGATPEKLITVANNTLETVALAGTKSANTVEWTDKEYDEHYMTEAFIEQLFTELKLPNYQKMPIETIDAGALQHLRSILRWKAKPELLRQKFSKILAGINPTPAVCGLPQYEASLFISKHEKLERRFYSGFIGLLQPSTTHLFVNIRCMQIGKQEALLYAGAGITQESNPQSEWEETERKIDILRKLI